MSTYSFSEEAVRDLDDICEYVGRGNPNAGMRLFDAIREKCKLVAGFPNMGKKYEALSPGLRGFTIDDYIVFYYPSEDGITVTRIASGYRDLKSLFESADDD